MLGPSLFSVFAPFRSLQPIQMVMPALRSLIITAALALACAPACSPSDDPRDRRPDTSAPRAAPAVLAAKPAARAPAPVRSFADFRPSLHGFHFVNSFSGSPLPISLGGLEERLNLPTSYGLCGGMSFAAADYFLAGREPPTVTDPPRKGDPLYTYLYTRQVESLGEGFSAVPNFAKWMNLDDNALFGPAFLTFAGLDAVIEKIRSGEPALLGLVLTSTAAGGMLWENHQVLAYALDGAGPLPSRIRIYDPNYPKNDGAVLVLTLGASGVVPVATGFSPVAGVAVGSIPVPCIRSVRQVPGRRDTQVRGFFLMPYQPKTPPMRVDRPSQPRGRRVAD